MNYQVLFIIAMVLLVAAIVGIFLNAVMPDKLGMKVKSFHGKEKS